MELVLRYRSRGNATWICLLVEIDNMNSMCIGPCGNIFADMNVLGNMGNGGYVWTTYNTSSMDMDRSMVYFSRKSIRTRL